jgi:uncharacterized protein
VPEWIRLPRQALTLWRLTGMIAIGVLAVVLLPVLLLLLGPVALAAGALALLALAALVWRIAGRRFAAWGYAERESDFVVRRGVLIRRLSVVPYGRMQFVDVISGPVERRFGLATVYLHTAAAASDAQVPGLTAAEAARLRDRLAELGEARAAGL